MRRLPAIAGVFAILGAALTAPLYAQIRGIPPSVTSIGSGGTPMTPGIGASVTSLGPAGLVDRFGGTTVLTSVPGTQPPPVRPVHNVIPFFWPAIYQPQPQPSVVVVQSPPPVVVVVERDPDDNRDRREPLVLEWKGDKYVRVSGEEKSDEEGTAEDADRTSDRKPAKKTSRKVARRPAEPLADSASQRDRAAEPEAPATVLVFLDGRRKDVKNYAIVAEFFYDLSDRLPKKILLADLNLDATIAANEERGIDFRLPTASSPNQVMTRP